MTQATHTPGPWRVEDGQTIWSGEELVGAAGRIGMPMEANARLIAAAPEMLAALEWAVETADTEQYDADWYAAARAAIAKAKGE